MLSREIIWFDPSLIKVTLEERQRQMELDIGDLIPSIRRHGIQSPLIVRENDRGLVTGWRRLTTALFLELKEVPVRLASSTLSSRDLKIIEFEENAKRKDLTWQDNARAFFEIHSTFSFEEPEWSVEKTANYMGFSEHHAYRMIDLGEAIAAGDKSITEADTAANATTILRRRRSRAGDDALNSILDLERSPADAENIPAGGGGLDTGADPGEHPLSSSGGPVPRGPVDNQRPATAVKAPPFAVIQADAHQFFSTYDGPKFNFLHCDFPYGVALNEQAGQQRYEGEGYESSPEIYWDLCESLLQNWDRVLYPSAHVMFWISMKFYTETVEFFEERSHIGGRDRKYKGVPEDLKINRTPLIWHKTDNKGIISDALRGPRNIYEAALLMSTGDRKIVKPVSNVYGCPTAKATGDIHSNQKPVPMLKYFFSMLVDERSRVLDPTCGSGTSICAAEELGAEAGLGLEFNPEFADRAQKKLLAARGLRQLAGVVKDAETMPTSPLDSQPEEA